MNVSLIRHKVAKEKSNSSCPRHSRYLINSYCLPDRVIEWALPYLWSREDFRRKRPSGNTFQVKPPARFTASNRDQLCNSPWGHARHSLYNCSEEKNKAHNGEARPHFLKQSNSSHEFEMRCEISERYRLYHPCPPTPSWQ